MKIGYARTSTLDQTAGLEAQLAQLDAAGVDRVYSEQVSSVNDTRPELARAIDMLRKGDVLAVTKLDRLARSVSDMGQILAQVEAAGAALQVLDMNLDTSTPTGRLMLNMLGSVAQFEREIMLERQREGIAKAKAEGKYRGRAPTAQAQTANVLSMHRQGHGATEIAKRLGIGRSSVYRILSAQ